MRMLKDRHYSELLSKLKIIPRSNKSIYVYIYNKWIIYLEYLFDVGEIK